MVPKRIVPLCTLLALLLAFSPNASHSVAAPMQAIEDFNMLLGRPTDDSITVNVVPDQSGEISFEYGTGLAFMVTRQVPPHAQSTNLSKW